jgi:hypothetical protein
MTDPSNQPSKVAMIVDPRGKSIRPIITVICGVTGLAWLALNVIVFISLGPVAIFQWALLSAIPLNVVWIGCWMANLVISKKDTLLGFDKSSGEVILATRYFGRAITIKQYTAENIWRIHIWCRDGLFHKTWNAELELVDERQVRLARTRGTSEAPPAQWARRFEKVSGLLGKPLEIL